MVSFDSRAPRFGEAAADAGRRPPARAGADLTIRADQQVTELAIRGGVGFEPGAQGLGFGTGAQAPGFSDQGLGEGEFEGEAIGARCQGGIADCPPV